MSGINTAKITSNHRIAESQYFMAVDVPQEVLAGYKYPAQYVRLGVDGEPDISITIANRPGRDHLEFLIKDKGEKSHKLAMKTSGDFLNITKPLGPGFPVSMHKHRDIVLCANGVAISAVRSVIEEIMISRLEYGRVTFFYGERTADHVAFHEEHGYWKERGIELYISVSQPYLGSGWAGQTGYLQEHIEIVSPDLTNAVAFVVGSDGMMNDTRDMLERLGLSGNRIYVNY